MPVEFTLEAVGEVQVQRVFQRFAENARNTGPLWTALLRDFRRIEEVQFLTQGSHGSGGWAKLKESTLAAKESKHQQPWILRATEALFKSLTQPGATGQIAEVLGTFMRFGTSIPYAGFSQTGTPKMPQRRVVQFTAAERVGLAKSVQRFIITGKAGSIYD